MSQSQQTSWLLRLTTPALWKHNKRLPSSSTKYVFIISTGRTGTTYLAEYFGLQDSVYATHEPKPSRILRAWSMAHLDGKASNDYLHTVLYNKRKKMLANVSAETYIESNPFLVGFPQVLPRVFDKPLVVHVVRDPREYVRSMMNHGNNTGLKLLFNKYVPYWQPNIKTITKPNGSPEVLYQAANFWRLANQNLIEFGKNNPDSYRMFKYEDVFKGDQHGLREIADFIGLKAPVLKPEAVSQQGVNQSRFNEIDSWQTWSDERCQAVSDLCEPLMGQLGYGQEKAWQDRLR